MDREAIDTWLQRAILALVIGALVFGVAALGGVRSSELVIVEWLVLGAVGLWLIRLWLAPRFRFLMPPTAWAVVPFVLYGAWRYRCADIEYVARQEFFQALLAAIVFLLVVNNLFGQTEVRILAVALICAGTLAAMYGIYQWLTHSQHVWHFTRPSLETRASGTYINANHLAGFLEMVWPLATAFTLLRGFSALWRVLFAYASFVMLVGIAATGSRGGWLSTAVAVIVFALLLLRQKSFRWAGVFLVICVVIIGWRLYTPALESRMNPSSAHVQKFDDIRFRLWSTALRMWKDHPWIGVGPGHFDYRYPGYRLTHWEVQGRPGYVHNDYLNALTDWGVVGLTLILLPVVTAAVGVVCSWKYLHRTGDVPGQRVSAVLGATVGLISLLVHSFVDFNMHIPANALVAVALVALVTTHWRFATQRYWITARWPLKIAGTLILVVAGSFLGQHTWQQTLESRAMARADRARDGTNERIAALEEVFRIEPKNPETAKAIAENLRAMAWAGGADYRERALQAVEWFNRTAELNRWDPYVLIGAGMCLDWVDEHDKATPYFASALNWIRTTGIRAA